MSQQRCLLVRLDRIGDLVLSLPVDESLARRNYTCDWWISPGLDFVTTNAKPPRKAVSVAKDFSFQHFRELLEEVRRARYDVAVVFHAPWWISLLLWLAHVPLRIGVRSQWHSFLFFNRAIRQKRSDAEFSEFEYNFQLVEKSLNLPVGEIGRQNLRLKAPDLSVFAKHGLEPKKYFVVHPGMGGSALNWPIRLYIDLIDQLVREATVVITGTAIDTNFLAEIKQQFHSHPRVKFLDSELNGTQLIAVLQASRAVVAPSTGVLHLAASTDTPTIGIFSPVQVQQPRRWGPQGLHTTVLVPAVQCPGKFACLGRACSKYNCMDRIAVTDVMDAVLKQV